MHEGNLLRYGETGESVPDPKTEFGRASIALREAEFELIHAEAAEHEGAAERFTQARRAYGEAAKALEQRQPAQ